MPPCVANTNLWKTVGNVGCNSITACAKDLRTYSEGVYTTAGLTSLSPIGISKDGYIVYGPYDSNGKLW
jgi:hypothetical protein